MSPEERQLLQGLFDRMRSSSNAPRDQEAEQMISDQVRSQPYSPYLLAQTVIVQDQALQAANGRLQQLEQQVQQLRDHPPAQQSSGSGGFLSGLFGGGAASAARPTPPATVPQQRPSWNQGATGYPPQGYAPQPQQGGPWGGAPQQGGQWGGAPQQPAGGGFLKGALGTAAGVAGGVLMADGIRNLFSSGHAGGGLGIGSGVPGVGSGSGLADADRTQDALQDQNAADQSALSDADRTQDEMQDQNYLNQQQPQDTPNADWQQDADQDQDLAQDADQFGSDDY